MIPVTTLGNVGHEATRLLAHDPARPQPGQGPRVAGRWPEIAALIDAGERRLNVSERELLSDTAAIHERAEAGDLRGRVVLIPEG